MPIIKTPLVSTSLLEQQQISPPSSPPQLQNSPISPPNVNAPQPTNPNTTTPRAYPSRVSDGHVSDGTPEGLLNFEPKPISPESPPIILPSHPSVYGPDFDESRINLTVKYPKQPTKSSHNFGKVLRKFEYESKSRLLEAMTLSSSSVNPVASDSTWEAYRSWMNSKIYKLEDIGYTLAESKFRYGLVPLMEL